MKRLLVEIRRLKVSLVRTLKKRRDMFLETRGKGNPYKISLFCTVVMWKAEPSGYIAKEISRHFDKSAGGFMLLLRVKCDRKEVS